MHYISLRLAEKSQSILFDALEAYVSTDEKKPGKTLLLSIRLITVIESQDFGSPFLKDFPH